MRATITIDVPDDFLDAYVRDVYAAVDEPVPAADVFLRERLEGVADDELRIALWGWPIASTAVEILPE